jgi:hypothetical protein
VGIPSAEGKNTVTPHCLQIRIVAEERVGQLERVCKHFLREGRGGADPQDLDVQILEFAEIDLPGREVLCSRWVKIAAIEFNQEGLFSLELAQANVLSQRAGKREIRRFSPDLQC